VDAGVEQFLGECVENAPVSSGGERRFNSTGFFGRRIAGRQGGTRTPRESGLRPYRVDVWCGWELERGLGRDCI